MKLGGNLLWYERLWALVTAVLLISADLMTDFIGMALFVGLVVLIYTTRKQESVVLQVNASE